MNKDQQHVSFKKLYHRFHGLIDHYYGYSFHNTLQNCSEVAIRILPYLW